MKEVGIYVHIPFCKSKCNYCDFNSFANKTELVENYINSLQKEIKKAKCDVLVKTIYIGGGTPSYINEEHIKNIVHTLYENFTIDKDVEFTIEVNPGTVNLKKLQTYFDLGINRLSIGLQSSNDNLLKMIGRVHSYKQFLETVESAKRVGFSNINADVMLGLPNQTIYDVEDTLNELIKLELTHISIYSLIVEPNTKLERMLENKELNLPDDEIERYMYWFAKRKLEENGYLHYEISNFAKIPYRSKHNVDCWNQKEYMGFGISASSYIDDRRYKNIDVLEEYIKNIEENNYDKNIIVEEKQNKEIKMKEYMILGLRKLNGININEFRKRFNTTPLAVYNKELAKLLKEDLITVDVNNIRLSKKGLDLANIVWEEFI